MRRFSRNWGNLTKPEAQAVIDAIDQFLEDNQAALNSAIPQPGRTALNTADKTLITSAVALARAGILPDE
jgi:hypothetical protein